MQFSVISVDKIGLVSDLPLESLPPEAWRYAFNTRFRNGRAETRYPALKVLGAAVVAPYWGFNYRQGAAKFWFYAGLQKFYATDGTTHWDITRTTGGDYTTTISDRWSGGIFNGIVVVNNGVDVPQMMVTVSPSSNDLTALTNWPATYRCRVLRFFKSYIIALDILKGSTRYATLVKWSHQADPGAIPSSWDETNPAVDAGEQPLADTQGAVLDLVPMHDMAILYKEDSVWSMQISTGDNVFAFRKIFSTIGLLATNCVAALPDGSHVLLTQDDIVLHNGQQYKSIAENRIRKDLFAVMDPAFYYKSFVTVNSALHEVWICIPPVGQDVCTLAYCWNWDNQTWSLRDLPNIEYAALGYIDSGVTDIWNSDSNTWDSDSSVWNAVTYSAPNLRLVGVSPDNLSFYDLEPSTFDSTGEPIFATLEKTYIAVPANSRMQPDLFIEKYFQRLWLRIKGTDGTTVQVTLAAVDSRTFQIYGPTEQFIYTIGETSYIDFALTSALLFLRLDALPGDSVLMQPPWTLSGYEIEYVTTGRYTAPKYYASRIP